MAIAFYLDDSTFAQIMLNCFQSIAVTAYIFESKPFKDKYLNYQEKFNELTILLISYCVFMISDWVEPDG